MPNHFIKFCVLFIAILQIQTLTSQNNIFKGKIIDFKTKEPIAFANIIFNDNKSNGIITDINGLFTINRNKNIATVKISYVGYYSKTIKIEDLKNPIIELKQSLNQLNEIKINSKENPANVIIRKVIENKAINNPKNIKAFSYNSYNKVVFDAFGPALENDTIKKMFEGKHVFMTETASERKYLYPKFSEEVILGTKVSGFKNPTFASLATDIQPFSFYEDLIKLYNLNFLNPISNGSLKKYKFKIENEYYTDKDTIYIISFKPKPNKNFEALKGLLYINSNKYAIQNVDATPFDKLKITIKIQQQYTFVDNKYWFPEQLNYEMKMGTGDVGVKSSGKSFVTNVKFGQEFTKKDFSLVSIKFDRNATKKDSLFWNKFRNKKLNIKERETYIFMDSLNKKYHIENRFKILESLIDGRYKLKYFDIDLNKTIVYNRFEGFRLGTGLYTNESAFKNISIGGFFGYGTKDKTWKYGGEIITKIPSTKDISIALKYQNSLKEYGINSLNNNYNLSSPENIIAFRMNRIKEYSVRSYLKLHRNMDWSLQFSNTEIIPKYNYKFVTNNIFIDDYTNSEMAINLKYTVRERIITSFNRKVSLQTNYPVLNLTYAKGVKNLFKSDFNYNKFELSVDHTFTTRNLGITSYHLNAGYVDADVPYSLLFTREGGLDAAFYFIFKNRFQTSEPYEFVSDTYVNLFTTHNFGGLLFKISKFQPDIVLHNNIGYGTLKNRFKHKEINFKTKEHIFLETGIEIKNILKLNFLNMGSIGFGGGAFYRYGHHSFPKSKDNLVFKFRMGFTIK